MWKPYNTIGFINAHNAEVLGLPPMNLNDTFFLPMAVIFDTTPSPWRFTASPSAVYLYNTQLLLPAKPAGLVVPKTTHNAKYWAQVMQGMDFSDADLVDPREIKSCSLEGDDERPALSDGKQ